MSQAQTGIIEESKEFPLIHGFLYFWIFRGGLESGRHPRGFPDPVVSILLEYQLKWSHNMDPVWVVFNDFVYFLHILQPSLVALEAKNSL